MEPHVVAEMRVMVQQGVPSVGSPLAVNITSEDVDDTVLNLFSNLGQIHVITAASGALDLQMVSEYSVDGSKSAETFLPQAHLRSTDRNVANFRSTRS